MQPWDGIIPQHEQDNYRAAGFGRRSGLGKRPALLIIDVQYRTVGTTPKPFAEAILEFPTSCGEVAWDAVGRIAELLALFRAKGWPVLYPHVAPKESFDTGPPSRQGARADGRGHGTVMTSWPRSRPVGNDILLPKKHPSAFFGTPLASYLIGTGRRHAGGDGLQHQRLRARVCGGCLCL